MMDFAHPGKSWTCSETVPLASSFALFHLYSDVEARLPIGDCRFQPRAVQKTNEDCPIMDKALLVCLSLALTFRTRRGIRYGGPRLNDNRCFRFTRAGCRYLPIDSVSKDHPNNC